MQRWPNTAQTFLIYALALPTVNAADDLSDFSNNLATDIGPLLVLFGESITRQYLSESTTFLDYFIFAMAPIGVVTAIISVIRVCGHTSLRAFIGRSQEGDGIIEAELCASTSRDVCELFTRGGIARVLGRPSILELVYIPRKTSEIPGAAKEAPLYLFRHHLENLTDPDTSEWQEQEEYTSKTSGVDKAFAQNPNLSLNVGIKKKPDWVFYAVAATGFTLQAGLLVLAGIGVWILRWNLTGTGSSASRNYAPVMYITGTILMCTGMWSCAALIGQATHERRYKRGNKSPPSGRSRLIWLQPGPQVIGDQSFDPFAYFENTEEDPLQVWTSSRKSFVDFELHTFLAVITVLVGYIMQFIGLRGMKAWVSLAHLAITLTMSILRGCLRMQRLGRNDNKLNAMPDMVAGHELDWLSFEIVRQESPKVPSWHVTGQFEKAVKVQGSSSPKISESCKPPSKPNTAAQSKTEAQPVQPVQPETKSKPGPEKQLYSSSTYSDDSTRKLDFEDLLAIRERLAHLTGYTSQIASRKLEDAEYQKWKDSYVKVRTKAGALSTAICRAAEDVFRRDRRKVSIMLRIRAAAAPNVGHGSSQEQPIDIILNPPSESSQTAWSIDSARLEAILGLWMWTMISDHHIKDETDLNSSIAGRVQCSRIISAGLDDDSWDHEADRQGEMDLWLGSNAVIFDESILTVERQSCYGIASLWTASDNGHWEPPPTKDEKSPRPKDKKPSMRKWGRFCGWNSLPGLPRTPPLDSSSTSSGPERDQKVKLRVQVNPTTRSLLDICAQELFASLTMSLAGVINIEPTTTTENDGSIQLNNSTLSTFAKEFVESGLGSYSEALLCLLPASGSRFTPEDMVSVAIQAAETYRKASEWDRAEDILRWACARHARDPPALARALRAMVEIYLWSLARWTLARDSGEDERKPFATDGVDWLTRTYGSDKEIAELLEVYRALGEKLSNGPRTRQDSPTDDVDGIQGTTRAHPLIKALQDQHKLEALYCLCFVTTDEFSSEYLRQALPLAVRNDVQGDHQNDWGEVVNVILEMKANMDSQDEGGRTAISYCAEFGHELYTKRLILLGAFLDQPDHEGKTPLLLAAHSGKHNVAKLLLSTGQVNVNAKDQNDTTPLLMAARRGHAAIVKLLLEKGADAKAEDRNGSMPLLSAAEKGHAAIVKLLLEKGTDIEARDSDRNTPLLRAVMNGHEATAKLLLERGADIEATESKDSMKPLLKASMDGHEAIVKLLLEMGADMEVMDSTYSTPLLWAARNGHEATVKLLLDRGADVKASDGDYMTPLRRATTNGHEAIVKLLLDRGAKW